MPLWRWSLVQLTLLAVATLLASGVRAQVIKGTKRVHPFIGRAWLEPYQNYAKSDLWYYAGTGRIHKQYDPLGGLLARHGLLAWTWVEHRPGIGVGNRDIRDGSVRLRDRSFWGEINMMSISSDRYKGWRWNFTVATLDIRANFTSFTLRLPRFTGIALDIASEKNAVTLLYTRGYPTWRQNIENLEPGPLSGDPDNRSRVALSPQPLFGAHWQTAIGDAVKLGATFVNIHAESARSKDFITQVRGGLPYEMLPPERIILTFSDDSPEDGIGGAAIFGEPIVRVIAEGDSVLTRFIPAILGGQRVGGHWEANGFEVLSFAYDMPLSPIPIAMEIEATVANDYRIGVNQEHKFFNPLNELLKLQLDEKGDPVLFVDRGTEPVIVDRAEGNIRDFSNKRKVRFRYGFNTGTTRYGVDLEADFGGLALSGELALSSTYQQFPTPRGEQLSPTRDSAWFINAVKTLGDGLDVGLELFHVGPKYGGYQGSREGYRGGVLLYHDRGGNNRNETINFELPLVDDNDDWDKWSDDDISNEAVSELQNNRDAGVFPGQDEDRDATWDQDKNENRIPDFEEPFLLYHSDPVDFLYGFDWNNNLQVDQHEDDEKPDFRYDKDLEGSHLFAAYRPIRPLEVAVGRFDSRGIAEGTRNDVRYVRTRFVLSDPARGEIEIRHDTKRVRDDIRNSYYTFAEFPAPAGPQPGDPGYDTLLMRNSIASTFWLGTRYSQVLNLHVENNVRILDNHQLPEVFKDGTSQDDVRRTQFTMVNRFDYRFRFGKWRITPMFKRLTLVETATPKGSPRVAARSQSWTAPILKVDYQISKNTILRLGQQGFRLGFVDNRRTRNFAAFRFRNKRDPLEEFASSDFVILFQNRSNYFGKEFISVVGYHRQAKEFMDRSASLRNQRFSRLFIELVSGV